ncbi:hypothetical protein F5148DRAFT_1367741 [Russula earlei]|uniref:Uncharacterized protein n=1 Tax=Russula earlei TaxID=71964 RepID=A0ACC0UBQ9_9AGAM|nr:hypothetical protein F5148DRAFT_1367741 [Russula earlei]
MSRDTQEIQVSGRGQTGRHEASRSRLRWLRWHVAIGGGEHLRTWSRDVSEVTRGQPGGNRTHDGYPFKLSRVEFSAVCPYACGVVVAAAVPRSSVVQDESELATDKPSRLELLATKRGVMERSRSSNAASSGERQGVHIRRRAIDFVALVVSSAEGSIALSTEVEGVVGGRAGFHEGASSTAGGDGMCERASGRGDDVKRRVRRAAGISGVSLVGDGDREWSWGDSGEAEPEVTENGAEEVEDGAGTTIEAGTNDVGATMEWGPETATVSNKEAAAVGKTVTGEGEAKVVGGEAETARGPETDVAGWRAKLELRQLEVRQLLEGVRHIRTVGKAEKREAKAREDDGEMDRWLRHDQLQII